MPGQPGKAFGADCEVVPAVRPSVITEGTWLVRRPGAPPLAEFTLVSRRLSAEGTWDEASSLGVCITCVPGQVVTPRLVFDQPTPMTDVSFARGEATVGGTTFEFVEFGGRRRCHHDSDRPSGVPPQLVSVTTPFALSGNLKGFEVVGRRDPLLVFDAQVTGSGVATLELLTTGTPAQFYRLRFVFSE